MLDHVLAARDRRAEALARARAEALVHARLRAGAAVIGELGLNVPGWPKRGALWRRPFARGLARLRARIAGLRVLALRADAAGYWALLAASAPPRRCKALSCAVEDEAAWGRLLDVDWYEGAARLSREALGLRARACWVCGGEQIACISALRHPIAACRAQAEALARAAGSAREASGR